MFPERIILVACLGDFDEAGCYGLRRRQPNGLHLQALVGGKGQSALARHRHRAMGDAQLVARSDGGSVDTDRLCAIGQRDQLIAPARHAGHDLRIRRLSGCGVDAGVNQNFAGLRLTGLVPCLVGERSFTDEGPWNVEGHQRGSGEGAPQQEHHQDRDDGCRPVGPNCAFIAERHCFQASQVVSASDAAADQTDRKGSTGEQAHIDQKDSNTSHAASP